MNRDDRAWVATRKGLFELALGADGRWRVEHLSFLGEPVTVVLPPVPAGPHAGRMLAALNLGHFGVKLHASDDGGRHWHEVAAPAYPPQPADAEGPAWTLLQVWALEAGADGRVWAGTMPGGLFHSDDFGQTWRLAESLWRDPRRARWMGGGNEAPGMHSVCLHPHDAGDVVVAVSCGGVWRTRDAGASWTSRSRGLQADFVPPELTDDEDVQDPHRVIRSAVRPEVLWCQHHCGIWRSTDEAASWQRLHAPVSSFGFALAVHPRDADTAWFVPAVADMTRVPVGAALAVNRTRDGGASWQTLRAGLPQQDCYDLVYRHGLDVSPDGQRLLMGSTTGNLWAGEDGGERWQPVSATLPPIAALKFG